MDHDHAQHMTAEHQPTFSDYLPLIGIALGLLLAVAARAVYIGSFDFFDSMRIFMGLFFLVFGGLKVIKLSDFVMSYMSYDLIASRSRAYAYIYPFIELALAAGFLMNLVPNLVNVVTLIVMSIGALGVWNAIRQKRTFVCACLGGVFKLPLSTVTLFEDLLMAAMAAAVLIKEVRQL